MIRNEKAQLYTIEGIATSIMLLLVVIFVIKAAPLTPLTSSASNPHTEAQLETLGNDLLTTLDYSTSYNKSTLKKAIIAWRGGRIEGQNSDYLPNDDLKLMIDAFNKTLQENGIAYNLDVTYNTNQGTATRQMILNGIPSDNAVIVSRKIILHDEDKPSSSEVIVDINPTKFYNMLDVRLTLWRM